MSEQLNYVTEEIGLQVTSLKNISYACSKVK